MNAAWAAVIGALFGMIGTLGTAYMNKPRSPSELQVTKPTSIETLPKEPSDGSLGFGQWTQGLKAKVAYKAENDGFVAAVTGGKNPAKGIELLSGPSPNGLVMRTRVWSAYDGAILPVRKGDYWLVSPTSNGDVNVQWLPSSK